MNPPDARDEEDYAALRLRLQGGEAEALAARAEARRLARELALVRRLLRFSGRAPSPGHPSPPTDAAPGRAVLLTARIVYHLDACENHGAHTTISGWAFRPASGWDARDTAITLRLRHGATVYQAAAVPVPRPDVAAFYAAQPADLSGGATGLEGAGFACEVRHDSLPAGVEFEIGLRLECGGLACEQPTGTPLRF